MAVIHDADGTADGAATTVTSINFTAITVGSGVDRALVVTLAFNAVISALAVTWDNGGTNQAMTQIAVPRSGPSNGIGFAAETAGPRADVPHIIFGA